MARIGTEQFAEMPLPEIRVHAAGAAFLRHWSAVAVRGHWRAFWNSTPGSACLFEGRRLPLVPQRLVVIPPDTPVTLRLEQPAQHLWLHFSAGQPYDRFCGRVFSFRVDTRLRATLESLEQILHGATAVPRIRYRRAMLVNLIVAGILARVPARLWPTFKDDPRIQRTVEFMTQNLREPASNAMLADMAGMSVSAFIRGFHAEIGEPPQAFRQRLRLQHAGLLLQQTELKIEEIAGECGFCDRYYLSKLFKRHYGLGPAAYRRAGKRMLNWR